MPTTRMFVAIRPPDTVREQMAEFLAPREGMTWIDQEQWHITLAFLPAVPEHRDDELIDALQRTALRHTSFEMCLSGAGAFPNPREARVLWLRPSAELTSLATGVRHAANSVGATPDGQRFVGHVSVARPRHPIDARRWLQVLDTFTSGLARGQGGTRGVVPGGGAAPPPTSRDRCHVSAGAVEIRLRPGAVHGLLCVWQSR